MRKDEKNKGKVHYHQEYMHPDFFSGTFYSMRTKYKKKYCLLKDDVADYLFESFFIITIQALLCCLVLVYGEFRGKLVYHNKFEVNLTMFFTVLVLHFSCIATVRNGINMCRFVIFHREEFDNPKGALGLGFVIVLVNVLCAITNMLLALSRDSVEDVISKFVSFKLLIQI